MVDKKRLYLFWNIGKNVFNNQKKYDNPFRKYSLYYQYKYGISSLFCINNIKLMYSFYLCFPIFYDSIYKVSWDEYKVLININSLDERMFYFELVIFSNSDVNVLLDSINSKIYQRI